MAAPPHHHYSFVGVLQRPNFIFRAEFTKMYALQAGEGIRRKKPSVFIIKRESKEVPTLIWKPDELFGRRLFTTLHAA
jgi:hypothetical protein